MAKASGQKNENVFEKIKKVEKNVDKYCIIIFMTVYLQKKKDMLCMNYQ